MTILPRVLQEGDKGGQGGTTGRDARDPRPAAAARGPRPAALLSEAVGAHGGRVPCCKHPSPAPTYARPSKPGADTGRRARPRPTARRARPRFPLPGEQTDTRGPHTGPRHAGRTPAGPRTTGAGPDPLPPEPARGAEPPAPSRPLPVEPPTPPSTAPSRLPPSGPEPHPNPTAA